MNWQTFRLRALWCWHHLLVLALIVLVAVAVVVGVARQFLPELDSYRPRLETELSARMGLPVRLAGLEGTWEGFGLRLQLHDLQLRDPAAPDRVLMRIPEVELRPALWQSLRHREPRVDVRLSGLDIHFDQLDDGSMRLRELSTVAGSDPAAAEQALRFALRQPALVVNSSRVGLALKGKPTVDFSDIDLVNINSGDRHQLAGRLRVTGNPEPLGLQLELNGDPLRWQESDLHVWLHLPVVELDRWLPVIDASDIGLEALTGGGEYWFHFRRGQLQSLQGQLDWRDIVINKDQTRHRLQHLTGELDWSRDAADAARWQLAVSRLQGRVDNLPWPLPSLALRGEGDSSLEVALAHADIAATASVLATLPVPEKLALWLRDAAPQGRLPALRAGLVRSEEKGWQPQWLDVRLAALSLRATKEVPGATALAGWLRWTPEQSWLGLETQGAEINLPQLFRERIAVHKLSGHLRLRTTEQLWHVDSDHLQLANADARGNAVLSVDVPRADPGAARLSLLAGIQEARAVSTWRYVPWPVAGDAALDWLRRSILGGRVSQGDFLYEGPLHDRKDLAPHRMLMRFAVTDGRLDYAADWPELKNLAAEVSIEGNRLTVNGKSLQLLDASRGENLQAVIPDLQHPVLQVQGDISSSGADLMRLFRESALREHTAGVADALSLDGKLRGHLELSLPLQSLSPEVDVRALLERNRLLVKQAGLTASELSGEVRYSSRAGLETQGLRARLLEAPVTAKISSQVKRGTLTEVDVSVSGQAGVPALRRWLGSNLLDLASGSTAYQARITIPASAAPLRLQLNSTLAGMRLDMPPPLGKSATEAVPVQYQMTLGKGEQMARLQYGQRLAAGLVWNGSRLDRALLRLSGSSPAWPQNAGIEIEGSLARLDVSDWLPWLQRFKRSPAAATVAARGETPLPSLTRLNIEVDQLLAEGMGLQNARLGLQRSGNGWQGALDSDELVGTVLLPDSPGAEIRLSFSRLQWPLPRQAPAHAQVAAPTPTPASVAAASAESAGLGAVPGLGNRPVLVNGKGLKLGSWPGLGLVGISARLLPSPYGLRIEDIAFDSNVLDFKGRLDWQWRGGVSTRVRGRATTTDMAGLLSAVGYAPSLVSPKASADLDLAWPGSPEKPVLPGLDGQLTLTVEQGRLLTVSNTTSASRVFGWLDVDNLKRRFKGDFSDVLKRGLSFDKASLSGPLQGGVIKQADFRVDGPTLKAEGHGMLDLARQQMDQQFTVTVPVSSAVPVAAVVVAGPLIGGAVAAAQMAFERQLDKVTQLRYHVSGSWADPKVERINMKILEGRLSGTAKTPAATPVPALTPTTGGTMPTAGGTLPVANGRKP